MISVPKRTRATLLLVGVIVGVTVVGACGSDPTTVDPPTTTAVVPVIDPGDGGDYQPSITAADFVAGVDNPYLPLRPGARWVYESVEDGETERIVVEVLDERRQVYGTEATVVRDQVFVDDELIEDTFDWYAQDREGNVWYLGEDTAEYEDGEVVTRAGSWEAGVGGALPGIVMPAQPAVGDAYRQEYLAGEAEDMGEVLAVDGTATVPVGTFEAVVTTADWTPLEPEVVEQKSYAPGVGLLLEEKVTGGHGRVELIEFTPGR
jgi:hypothetical protein